MLCQNFSFKIFHFGGHVGLVSNWVNIPKVPKGEPYQCGAGKGTFFACP